MKELASEATRWQAGAVTSSLNHGGTIISSLKHYRVPNGLQSPRKHTPALHQLDSCAAFLDWSDLVHSIAARQQSGCASLFCILSLRPEEPNRRHSRGRNL